MRGWMVLGLVAGCAGEPLGSFDQAPPPSPFQLRAGNFVAGATATLNFTGAPPSQVVRFAYGLDGIAAGACPPVLGGGCLEIGGSARLIAATARADASGNGSIRFTLPASVAGVNVGLQAVVLGATPALSNPVARLVGDVGTLVTVGGDLDGDGFTPSQGDCADFDPSIYPGAADTPGDGIDADCDDADGTDADGDGYLAGTDCDDNDAGTFPGARDLCDGIDNDCDGAVDVSAAGAACGRVDSFAGGSVVADLLFVVDNSGSMSEEQNLLQVVAADLFDPLTAAAADLHVGVVSTDCDDPAQTGKLQDGLGLRFSDGINAPYETFFTDAVDLGTSGSPVEQGLSASSLALTPPLLTGYNAGFLRGNADLHVIFVSDEPDASGQSGASWATWASTLKIAGPWRVAAHGLVGPVTGCPTAAPGLEYLDAVAQLSGVAASVCDSSYAPFMADLADFVLAGTTVTRYLLSDVPDVATLSVQLDVPGSGIQTVPGTDWTYDAASNRVEIFGIAVPPGSTVLIAYDL